MLRLDELANYFDIPDEKLDDEDVDTIAGLVVKELGRLAQLEDVVKYGEFTFTVKEIDGARITKLLILKEEKKQEVNAE
jgi:CBS domain containing-hemolysin-like protein